MTLFIPFLAVIIASPPAAAEGPPPPGWEQYAQFGQPADQKLAFTSLSDADRDGVTNAFKIFGTSRSNTAVVVCETWYYSVEQCWNAKSGQVVRLYAAYFGRLPDNNGFLWWMYSPQTYGISLAETSRQFYNSPEFERQRSLSNGDFVTYMYVTYLGRMPDQAGYDYWLDLLNRGYPRYEVIWAFSESAENKNFHFADYEHWHVLPPQGLDASRVIGVLVTNGGSCDPYAYLNLPCRVMP